MESIKTLAVIAVLGAVSYGVYLSMNRNPQQGGQAPQPNAAVAPPWNGGTQPGQNAAGGQASHVTVTPGQQIGPGGIASATPSVPSVTMPPAPGAAPSNYPPAYPAPTSAALGSNVGAVDPGQEPRPYTPPTALAAGQEPMGQLPPPLDFDARMRTIYTQLDEGKLAEAHLELTSLFEDSRLDQRQFDQVYDLLSKVAGTVIYSQQHFLERPYIVQQGDTFERIAAHYEVPPLLLSRINMVPDGQQPRPGTELKVVRGPFHAVVHLERRELILKLGDRFAGIFPIGVGQDNAKLEGNYSVLGKQVNPVYYGPGITVAADDPSNPLGEWYIDLGNQVALHGTSNPNSIGRTEGPGAIRLGDTDIKDIYGILSIGSRVVIQR